MALLSKVNVNNIGPTELEQFTYDVSIETESNKIVLKTDEIEISAFMKVLFDFGAHIEIYSAHDYPEIE